MRMMLIFDTLLASKGPSFERFPEALIYVNLVSSELLLAS